MEIQVIPNKPEFESLLELYPPILASKIKPEWYKKLPLEYPDPGEAMDMSTARKCPAIQDIINTGLIIPMWGKFFFKTRKLEEGHWEQRWWIQNEHVYDEDLKYHLGTHSQDQIGDMGIKTTLNKAVLKMTLPYTIKVPEGYNIMYSDPFYHFRKDIRCLPGIVEADKWGQITFPFEVLKSNFIMEAGTPLVHCLVYKREKETINIITEKGTHEDYYQSYKDTFELFSTEKNYRTK